MKRLIVAALAIAIAFASPAFADKPDKNKSKGKEKASPAAQTTTKSSAQATVTLHFGDREREAYRTYYTQQYGKGCPPGLAKKNNGCLPPGQAKKRYQIGQPLPHGIVILEPPRDVIVLLGSFVAAAGALSLTRTSPPPSRAPTMRLE